MFEGMSTRKRDRVAILERDKPASVYPTLVVCALIVRDDSLVLLEKRAPTGVAGLDGMWDLPGGKLECAEFPRAAVEREIREELGIEIEAREQLQVEVSSWVYADEQRRHWVLLPFRCEIVKGEPECGEALRWFPLSYLESLHASTMVLAADPAIIRQAMRPVHDPATCRLHGCGMCRVAKGERA